MKIMLLITADYASIEPQTKKLNIIGAFNTIFAKSFPCKVRRMAVAVKIRAELQDHHDDRKLSIELEDEDSEKLLHISGPFRFPQSGTGRLGEHSTVVELNDLPFQKPGAYNFVVYVDDEQLGRTSVELVQIPQELK
jgi:hypothetical protein